MSGETIHATTVAIEMEGAWHGVLLIGRSGSGKSDLALRLIDRGARLVADDYTVLAVAGDRLMATAPATIAGRIEVRGIGIVTMPALTEAAVAMCVALDMPIARMPDRATRIIVGVAIPAFAVAPLDASAPIKVEMLLRRVLAGEPGTIA